MKIIKKTAATNAGIESRLRIQHHWPAAGVKWTADYVFSAQSWGDIALETERLRLAK
jgi:hypothetical protein